MFSMEFLLFLKSSLSKNPLKSTLGFLKTAMKLKVPLFSFKAKRFDSRVCLF